MKIGQLTYREKIIDLDGRMFRRNEVYNDGLLYRVFFERFVPETSVYHGLGRYTDRHACWRLVSSRHQKLIAKLGAIK